MEPTLIIATCSVNYDGRAKSTLATGKYLIIIKQDGSLLIHDNSKLKPKNYIGPKATIIQEDDKIIATYKEEKIEIILENVENKLTIQNWDNNHISLTRSESDLRNKLCGNIQEYLGVNPVEIIKEYQVSVDVCSVGLIDVLVKDDKDTHHIVEVKRGQASLSACSQLYRYYCEYKSVHTSVKGYICSPAITKSGLNLLEKYGLNYVKINFD